MQNRDGLDINGKMLLQSMQNKAPLLEAVERYLRQHQKSYHVPGHMAGAGIEPELYKWWGEELFQCDLTELPGLDDLHQPTEAIRDAQKLAAEFFGSGHCYFLVNGSSCGLMAALLSLPGGSKVALPRNAHISIYHGVELAGLQPVYMQPSLLTEMNIPASVTAEEVKRVLSEHDVSAVIMINPSYYGVTPPLKEIADLTQRANIPLIVDEAHGAHFCCSSIFPPSAMECGAEIAVASMHKTGGSLTQTSLLHHRPRFIKEETVRHYLDMLQTTSPSYPLMISLDCARREMAVNGRQKWEEAWRKADRLRKEISSLPGVRILEQEDLTDGMLLDKTKLVLSMSGFNISGWQLQRYLREQYRIEPELADEHNVLLYMTYASHYSPDELLHALREIAARSAREAGRKKKQIQQYDADKAIPPQILTPAEANKRTAITVPLEEAEGHICAEMIVPYPPGIPVVCSGEMITPETVKILLALREKHCSIHGAADPFLISIRIIVS